ncbi:YdaS family helix-turn-helix protein [Sphingopyxis sp.]|uniref:transcriptional regulator n=1 Tax=Sphingopyxis sp. TaxID=1908224 RepID=UPI0025F7F2D0|nr:YdaS family helix-turn-helix protein [Sphingopyxis sp.]MBK6414086.1 helix-turn-helix domain-containing protein [Sphingopyxis sp.]
MDLKTYLKTLNPDGREVFARRCGTSAGHLRNIAYGKVCGEKLAVDIERESGRRVICETLRPDVDWQFLRQTPRAA